MSEFARALNLHDPLSPSGLSPTTSAAGGLVHFDDGSRMEHTNPKAAPRTFHASSGLAWIGQQSGCFVGLCAERSCKKPFWVLLCGKCVSTLSWVLCAERCFFFQ